MKKYVVYGCATRACRILFYAHDGVIAGLSDRHSPLSGTQPVSWERKKTFESNTSVEKNKKKMFKIHINFVAFEKQRSSTDTRSVFKYSTPTKKPLTENALNYQRRCGLIWIFLLPHLFWRRYVTYVNC